VQQPKIHDYAIIGDGRAAALISRAGSIDWLCLPRFESPPIFARLLDADLGGAWTIAPTAHARITRRYLEGTNVLETMFETVDGACTLVDLMPIAPESHKGRMLVAEHEVLRYLRCTRGEIELAVEIDPQPDFGRGRMRVAEHHRLGVRWQIGRNLLALRADVPLELCDDDAVRGTIRLRAGDTATLSLTFDEEGPALLPLLGPAAVERIDTTVTCWREWIARARYDGPYREQVLRSALTVKLMAFAPSGAIIAAPTTSLPESLGGNHNWDYRFCWLRDAAFTARAMLGLGYVDEAVAFCDWLVHTTRLTRPHLRVLYDVYGKRPPREHVVEDVRGYQDSRPVRIGNAAFDQLQLDCYGEVIDAATMVAHATGELDRDTRGALRDFGEFVSRNWHRPDQGIWEPRGQPEHRTHSRLLCWVALDRLLELARGGLLDRVDRSRLEHECAEIRADIEAHAYDPVLGAYTASLGSKDLDASVLLMSWYGFHPASDPRMRSTYARIRDRLGAGRGLLYRYDRSLRKREGAFWICSFWACEHLADGCGTLGEAHAMMRDATSYANDLGLMAEEVDPLTGDALGNFPQAYTHVGLVSAAVAIEERACEEAGPRYLREVGA
jgi:GH15 family glucan-1,4-alpha-glucosidase